MQAVLTVDHCISRIVLRRTLALRQDKKHACYRPHSLLQHAASQLMLNAYLLWTSVSQDLACLQPRPLGMGLSGRSS